VLSCSHELTVEDLNPIEGWLSVPRVDGQVDACTAPCNDVSAEMNSAVSLGLIDTPEMLGLSVDKLLQNMILLAPSMPPHHI
jgi:hypothetical protein